MCYQLETVQEETIQVHVSSSGQVTWGLVKDKQIDYASEGSAKVTLGERRNGLENGSDYSNRNNYIE